MLALLQSIGMSSTRVEQNVDVGLWRPSVSSSSMHRLQGAPLAVQRSYIVFTYIHHRVIIIELMRWQSDSASNASHIPKLQAPASSFQP